MVAENTTTGGSTRHLLLAGVSSESDEHQSQQQGFRLSKNSIAALGYTPASMTSWSSWPRRGHVRMAHVRTISRQRYYAVLQGMNYYVCSSTTL
jgi:hypothetical protein